MLCRGNQHGVLAVCKYGSDRRRMTQKEKNLKKNLALRGHLSFEKMLFLNHQVILFFYVKICKY